MVVFQGVVASKIAEKHGLMHLRMDVVLSQQMKYETSAARRYRWFSERGLSVPAPVLCQLLNDAIAASAEDSRGWLLDGFPAPRCRLRP